MKEEDREEFLLVASLNPVDYPRTVEVLHPLRTRFPSFYCTPRLRTGTAAEDT
jgi:hypothetical protein